MQLHKFDYFNLVILLLMLVVLGILAVSVYRPN